MQLTKEEAIGGKTGAMILIEQFGWERAAVIAANQRNVPVLCVILWGLNFGEEDLRWGWQFRMPGTKELLESGFPDNPNELCDDILAYM